jgi:hypothetical protein
MRLSAGETELLHALQRFIERIEWFSIGRTPEDGLETDKVRLLLAQWDEEVVPHIPSAQNAHILSELRKVAPAIATMRAKARLMFLNALHQLVETRFHWLMLEKYLRAPELLAKQLKEGPPEKGEAILALLEKHLGGPFDAAKLFQDIMAAADRGEEAWKKHRGIFSKEWGDEITPEIESRLQGSDATGCALWMAELLSAMLAIQKEHPSLA